MPDAGPSCCGRPKPRPETPAIAVRDGLTDDLPNLVFAMPRERPALLRLLRAAKADRIEAHHLADYPPAIYDLIAQLGLPYDVHVHDYAWFCPRVSLVAAHNRYCGEPDLRDCEACVADNGISSRRKSVSPRCASVPLVSWPERNVSLCQPMMSACACGGTFRRWRP